MRSRGENETAAAAAVASDGVVSGSATEALRGGSGKTHELYTVAAGLYLCWLGLKVALLAAEWGPRGWASVVRGLRGWSVVVGKCVVAGAGLVGLVPYLVGLLFQLVVLAPVRVRLHQSPLFYPWQDWALGIVHCKIICAAVMMGPDWWMRRSFERVYQEGVRGLELRELYRELIWPVVAALGLSMAVPYALASAASAGAEPDQAALLHRHIYPSLLLFSAVAAFLLWQFRQFSTLILRIRNEKYLVGQRLVNYDRRRQVSPTAAVVPVAAS